MNLKGFHFFEKIQENYIHTLGIFLGQVLQTIATDEESDQESSDEEFEYNSEIDDSGESSEESSDKEEEDVYSQHLNIEEVFNGRYVVYKWSSRKYYLGTVTDVTSSSDDQYDITVSLMKKNTVRGNRVYFIWPTSPHVVVIDDLQTNQCLRSISVPMIDRRGTTAIYDTKCFNKLSTTNVY